MTCIEVAKAAGLKPGGVSGAEHPLHCPGPGHPDGDQHASLLINVKKDCWMCGPCGQKGTAWQLAAFLAGVEPSNRPAVCAWLNERGLTGRNDTTATSNGRREVATYPYQDESSHTLYEVVRYDPKGFRQRKTDGTWSLHGVRRVLYRLPQVLGADTVYVVEGERDVDNLRAIGLTATCNPGGAGKWRPEYAGCFNSNQRVVIVPDNDEPGRKHAHEVAQSLRGKVGSIKILELPNLPPKGDVSDWLAAGGTREALETLVAATPEFRDPQRPEIARSPWGAAQSAEDFIKTEDGEVDFLYHPLLAPGSLTEIFSPRGIGKTQVALAIVKDLSDRGRYVLLLDRDNPKREIRRRLRAWGIDGKTVKVMTRDEVPPLTDADAWAVFPFTEYELVVVDSLDSSAEGIGENDSSKPSRAIASLLDIAHRANGPAILVLGNTIRTGAHSRGCGIVEDRADIVFEVRDATNLNPTGQKPWHEELPAAGAEAWAQRATRRKSRSVYRLAFVPSKFRIGEEPEPFLYEIDLSCEPWQLRDVTTDVVSQGNLAAEEDRRTTDERIKSAIENLEFNLSTAEWSKTAAEEFLVGHGIKPRKLARNLIEQHDGRHWNLTRRGVSIILVPVTEISAAKRQDSGSPILTGISEDANLAVGSGTVRRDTDPTSCRTGANSSVGTLSPPNSNDSEERL